MPAKHLRTLAKRCNLNTMRYMQEVIDLENAGYKYWPEVLKLAEETNPAGFAQWAAANPEKLPAKVAA
jgi:hypothetical protein